MLHSTGSLLTIDVGDRTTVAEDVDDVLSSFIGGRGVGVKLAHDRIPFDADPFGPENSLFFTTGPLQCSTMSFTGRMNCTGVSPLTDGLLSSNAGGFLSRHFAATGYGAVQVTGRSDDLVAVHVTDEGIEFEEVPQLAGATVTEVGEYMADEHDLGDEQLVVAGPAGENRVRFASIMTTEHRAFGRGGLGAVLGAKGVKCISFAGDSAPDIDIDPIQMDVHREAATANDHPMKSAGTTSVTEYANHVSALPTRYFSELEFEGASDIGGEAVAEKKYKKGTCSQCAFACKLPTKDEETGLETEGPEYETVMAFGSNAGVDDIVSVMKSNDLCDELGMDTISCGDVISAYLAANDEFGNDELVHDLVEKIAYREDEGDLLAEGVHRAADDLGVEDWTVKGLEFSAHDGRTLNGQGLAFAVSNRGADHMYAEFYSKEYPLVGKDEAVDPTGLDGKPPLIVAKENHNAVLDSGVVCKFSRDFMTEERLETLLDTEYERLQDIGAEIVELERHFNNERGFDREDDTLPYDLPDFEAALSEYYAERGWNDDGTVKSASASADD
ncbi:aldehyde:ferredoxin oxidoreductase [Haladaptatus paucihalophilus DX253]|uniref:Aldehyde:ferredoxin oxidoreductase n=1 Tax=Haladaptatus paucihalophilus DX253 TaxID=797209 RepID=E7QND9_HALPU|nr:aldehyde ferredoxin oxidoreductase C-terminal domain-containing protein [Haladaptatus paucihalophilus]EFW93934.1 aldehyde:ferredoxin oxidoreductase [Haladaptatus paucihalophilus DX253]SHK66435.1 aldehyde:ferredoxin oxidoreductase [Haladaptatus paucihalophilus DX253]